jgi:hypothetical protein
LLLDEDNHVEEIIMLAQGMEALPPEGISLKERMAEIERGFIEQALERADGNVSKTARMLNLQRTTLIEKIDKYRSTVEANGGLFEPFGLELYGRWGEAARSNVFKPLVTKLEDNGWDRSIASHYWCCRITLASMVTGMRLLLNRAAGLAADKEFHIFSQQDEDDESILMPRSAPAMA